MHLYRGLTLKISQLWVKGFINFQTILCSGKQAVDTTEVTALTRSLLQPQLVWSIAHHMHPVDMKYWRHCLEHCLQGNLMETPMLKGTCREHVILLANGAVSQKDFLWLARIYQVTFRTGVGLRKNKHILADSLSRDTESLFSSSSSLLCRDSCNY